MLHDAILCLNVLLCLAGSIVFFIQGPNPIGAIPLAVFCCLAFFVLGMIAQRELARWEAHRRRRQEHSDSRGGGTR